MKKLRKLIKKIFRLYDLEDLQDYGHCGLCGKPLEGVFPKIWAIGICRACSLVDEYPEVFSSEKSDQ